MEFLTKLQKQEKLLILGVVLSILFVATFIFFSFNKTEDQKTKDQANQTQTSGQNINQQNIGKGAIKTEQFPFSVVYGVWTGNSSELKSYDIASNTTHRLASIPVKSKKVTIVAENTILYIGSTDQRDHGKQIVMLDMKSNQSTVVYSSAADFGIDDYVVSPNGQYVAIWEVAFAQNSGVLAGGTSKVVGIDLTSKPFVSNVLYNQVQTGGTPVHYPRAVTNKGVVFLDQFLPGTEAGWAHGMSKINIDGTQKEDIASMEKGTYGTQPSLSSDSSMLVFAGYDGSRGSGNSVNNGFRQAILTPNTVEVYDIATNTRKQLFKSNGIISGVDWDTTAQDILFMTLSNDPSNVGYFRYNLKAQSAQPMASANNSLATSILGSIAQGIELVGIQDQSETTLGSLGDTYAQPFTSFSLLNAGGEEYALGTRDNFMQYIALVPSKSLAAFPQVLADQTGGSGFTEALPNLQLQTFYFQPALAEKRVTQQHLARCRTVTEAQCIALGSVFVPGEDDVPVCKHWKTKGIDGKKVANICTDSPLYLYGEKGTNVTVKIQTIVHNSNPEYPTEGYTITLQDAQKMEVNGKSYESISYDYTPGIKKLVAPTYGTIASVEALPAVVKNYAKNLGLNQKETDDLLTWATEQATTPYILFSFYDQKTSEKILPLSFTPQPDSYLNIVFYIKLYNSRPLFSPVPPLFPPAFVRRGLSAVEISGFVEK